MAGLFKVLPKVGPLRAIDFKEPTAKTEDLYFKSVDETIDAYGKSLRQVKHNDLQAPEVDLDTGKPTKFGEYPLADATYRELLDELAANHFADVTADLRADILNFYGDFPASPPPGTRIDRCVVERWQQTWTQINQLRAMNPPSSPDQPKPASSGSQTAVLQPEAVAGKSLRPACN